MVRLLHKFKLINETGGIVERVIWGVPKSVRQPQGIRYRLAYIPKGRKKPAVLYDNHHPKGHHKHIGDHQFAYSFIGIERLLEDFRLDIEAIK